MGNKLLTANFNKLKFSITVVVTENGNIFNVEPHEDGVGITYQEIIGALEIAKHFFISEQTKANKVMARKQKLK